ncbi:aminotransferase class III-fold pyridoxal phosphate-dependent enzyme [Roseivirga sp. E12]|uniref:aminotransferase class III-fold pyridoxal phosphate-dependent enzyme n=1 Tax=Roseivirga sp. E12 TaxID=2819237 RepID=UPI001ABC9A1D|nr:aminotransferase class III-fold pyridoxal phosphate-dependent enzyme [Roseivirga sp. E12]MBO3698400.1 aminotransferase class III-fold pyridoxal phosphate-dependent enzyme [Roseivirga sp. E12]
METVLNHHYSLTNVGLKPMEGYISENYLVTSDQGKYVLKVYDYSSQVQSEIEAETEFVNLLTHLNSSQVSRPVLNINQQLVTKTEEGQMLRLLSFVEGAFLAEAEHTPELFLSLGSFMGEIDVKLRDFKNPSIESRRLEWDLQNITLLKPLSKHIQDISRRKLVKHFFNQWDLHVYPILPQLRQSIIHNDANDWNILIKDGQVTGVIDFGDSVHTQLINELAIAITYGIFGKENPLIWASYIIKGYHQKYPLEQKELGVLYYLIAGRLITSVCKSAQEKINQPDSEYITISEKPAWDLLEKWVTINPTKAKNEFFRAAGFDIDQTEPIEEVLSKRRSVIGSNVSVSYKMPIYMESAAFQYMFDRFGNTYLDAYNNIPHVGHQHPAVVEAAQRQIAKLNTNTRYLYDNLHEYAEQLLAKFPEPLSKVFFVNSGSAASDLAIRLAQNFTQKKTVAVMEHGYHGNTRLGIDISHYKYQGSGGLGKADEIIEASLPNEYRSKFNSERNTGALYAQEFIDQLKQSQSEVAAFISEPIVGCGGQVPLAPGYLKEVYPYIRDQGGVCISDEVQTGFGRLGDYFWGFEMQGVVPDIIVLGKPIANGHPMGAVVTTDAIADAFDNGMEFFSSFGGNPVSCEIGKAVLNVIKDEELQENAKSVGEYHMHCLRDLKKEFPVIGDVRGSGLFIGIELVNEGTLIPNTELAQKIKNTFRERHILISTDGPRDSVIKSKPPLCFSKRNVDQVVDVLRSTLEGWKK